MPGVFQLSPEQRQEFEERGTVRLPGFYPLADIGQMADRLWAFLAAEYTMYRDRPETWTVTHPAHFQDLKRSGAFAALGSPNLLALVDDLLGAGTWDAPRVWGAPLVTFPTAVPSPGHAAWHLDIDGRRPLAPLSIFRAFTFLEPVRRRGGGTLYVSGSHRLAMEIEQAKGAPVRSKEVCNRLKQEHGWFGNLLKTPSADLPALMRVDARIGPQTVRLEEMTGEPGDLVLMHPAMLHGVGHNALDRPRLMLTEWIYRRLP
jgi:hypothetical protein